MYETKPWLKHYGKMPATIEYPRISLYEALMGSVSRHAGRIAWDFFGKYQTYEEFSRSVQDCANGLAALGLEAGDRITIAMPACPQGIIAFYAANCLGAVANIIHPLASCREIAHYLNISQSRIAVTLDAYFSKFNTVHAQTPLKTLILARITDYLPLSQKIKFALTKGRTERPLPADNWVMKWPDLFDPAHPKCVPVPTNTEAPAVILHTGGTVGIPKGVLLSNRNLIAAGMMISAWANLNEKDTILAILPLFHGFGLGVCVNAAFMSGARTILAPQFNPETVSHLIRSQQPTLIIGLPSLFQALVQNSKFQKSDLRCLRAAFCGADILPRTVRERFEEIVGKNGGRVRIQEGYGLTETVTAVLGNPPDSGRAGSIGMPFPDMSAKIVRPGTDEEVPCGNRGELCLRGPAVMLGYLNQNDETTRTLKRHRDGRTWLHTEDLCSMDTEGYFYFHLRLKRMVNASGTSVSPVQVEDRLLSHPDVLEACVIGLPDLSAVEKIKAFVVLKDARKAGAGMVQILMAHCRKELIMEFCPQEIEFRPEIPKTTLGKVAYHKLREQELEKRRSTDQYAGETGSPHRPE